MHVYVHVAKYKCPPPGTADFFCFFGALTPGALLDREAGKHPRAAKVRQLRLDDSAKHTLAGGTEGGQQKKRPSRPAASFEAPLAAPRALRGAPFPRLNSRQKVASGGTCIS